MTKKKIHIHILEEQSEYFGKDLIKTNSDIIEYIEEIKNG